MDCGKCHVTTRPIRLNFFQKDAIWIWTADESFLNIAITIILLYNNSEIMDDLFADVLKQLLLNEVRTNTDFEPILIHELNVCNLPNFPDL